MKYSKYLLILLLVFFTACSPQRKTNWNVGLQREGRAPYDLYLGYNSLGYFYPDASVSVLSDAGGISALPEQHRGLKSMLVLVGKSIRFNTEERRALLRYAEQGNELVLFSGSIDDSLLATFGLREEGAWEDQPLTTVNPGSANKEALSLALLPGRRFGISGRNLRGYFLKLRESDTSFPAPGTVAYAGKQQPNIYRIAHGEGHLTLVATPLILSNYFLLQPANREYLQVFWQQVGTGFDAIYWANYQHRNPDMSGWQLLMHHPAVRASVLLALLLALVYLLVETRRKQRQIPEIKPLENAYASFVETVGLLYFNHHDNTNLCQKMEQHFLEWVRLRYRLPTDQLDESFARLLSGKSGVDQERTQALMRMIHELRLQSEPVSDRFLFDFYTAIHVFYNVNK